MAKVKAEEKAKEQAKLKTEAEAKAAKDKALSDTYLTCI